MRGLRAATDIVRPGRDPVPGMPIRLDYRMFGKGGKHVTDVRAYYAAVRKAEKLHKILLEGKSPLLMDGNVTMTGWKTRSPFISDVELGVINTAARKLSQRVDDFYSIGIGGSYLGIRATVEANKGSLEQINHFSREDRGGAPRVFFIGNNIDPAYLARALAISKGKRVGGCVISKSGDTVEPAIAFNVLMSLMEQDLKAAEISRRMVAITDAAKGTLRKLANQKKFKTFVVPDNVGGRFSVTSPVGLFSLAVAGVNIEQFIAGAKFAEKKMRLDPPERNVAIQYAAMRYVAHKHWGKDIEVASTNIYDLRGVTAWMQQLGPESEGKNGEGLWVTPEYYTEMAHANGQMIQMGKRNMIETSVCVEKPGVDIMIPAKGTPVEHLHGKSLARVNANFGESLRESHFRGGVPTMSFILPDLSAFSLGMFYQTMMNGIALSGLLMGQNPFIQPGVQIYKTIAAIRTGKSGMEASSALPEVTLNPHFII